MNKTVHFDMETPAVRWLQLTHFAIIYHAVKQKINQGISIFILKNTRKLYWNSKPKTF